MKTILLYGAGIAYLSTLWVLLLKYAIFRMNPRLSIFSCEREKFAQENELSLAKDEFIINKKIAKNILKGVAYFAFSGGILLFIIFKKVN